MPFLFFLLSSSPFYDFPPDFLAWSGLVLMLAVLAALIIKNPVKVRVSAKHWGNFLFLLAAAVIFSLFFGFRFPASGGLIPFEFPTLHHSSAVMVFCLIPVAVAAGFLTPLMSALLGAAVGLLIGLFDTHSLITIPEYAGMGLCLCWLFQQRYRSAVFELLQHPLAAAIATALVFIPITMLNLFLSTHGEMASRTDFALTQFWPVVFAHFVQLFVAGAAAEFIYLSRARNWAPGRINGWLPWDGSISHKFVAGILPIFAGSLIILLIGGWLTASMAAKKLLENRLETLSDIASDTFPVFLDTGQQLIHQYAEQNLLAGDKADVVSRLNALKGSIPFFTDLRIVTVNGKLIEDTLDASTFAILAQEADEAEEAQPGVVRRPWAAAPQEGQNSARIVFSAPILNKNGSVAAVLFGYTDLQTNALTAAAMQAFASIEMNGGQCWVLDEDARAVYHTNPQYVMTRTYGSISQQDRFFEQVNPGESPRYTFFQYAGSRPWTVVLSVSSLQVQQTAMDIAVPLIGAITLICFLIIFFTAGQLARITKRMKILADQAGQIAKGQLDRPLIVNQPDEVGQLTLAFEQMRRGLKTRLKDINSLLKVSQAAAFNPDPRRTVQPVLESFVGKNASAARAVFFDSENMETAPRISYSYGIGHHSANYEELDEVVANLLIDQPRVILTDCSQLARLKEYRHIPGSLAAFRLQRETSNDGILWAAFDAPQQFSESDVNFFTALAGQAALSVANANLFRSAEIGRQRMEAVINSSPDPILVFTSNHRLLLMNPAAKEIPQFIMRDENGTPMDEVLSNRTLIEIIRNSEPGGVSNRELTLAGGKTYTATVAEVKSANREVGKVCLLRDVSRYKNLDSRKSEFVSTVSHEIQGPLSVMRGYIRMLDLLGETNPQQRNIIQKMNDSILQINELVGNILNLRRIETDAGVTISRVNTVELVEKITASMESKAMQKNIQLIITEDTETGIQFYTDPVLLQHALRNLVENGIRYTQSGGRVEISTCRKEGNVVFEVKDNGIGIAPIDVQFIFEEFYRVGQRAAFRQQGTGMGLSIVKTIAERLGGSVAVESQLGKGSTFFIKLPIDPIKE